MAIIILIQSWTPCKDSTFAKNGEKRTEFSTSSQQRSKDHSDTCSPFCQCSCCAGFSINHTVASVSTMDLGADRNFAVYLPVDIIEISLPIWQPPRLIA